jgi:putative transposase
MTEKALVAVIQEAWSGVVSTRRVDDLVQAMGLTGISKLVLGPAKPDPWEPSLQALQGHRRAGPGLPGTAAGERVAYLWLDATYLKQREGGRIVSVAAIIALAVNTDGRREIIRLKVGSSEAETFWSGFLKSLSRRGLTARRWQPCAAGAPFRSAAGAPSRRGASPAPSGAALRVRPHPSRLCSRPQL